MATLELTAAPAIARRGRAFDSNWLLIAPLLLGLLLLFLLPMLRIFTVSVTDPVVGLGNYQLLFSSPSLRGMVWTTVSLSFTTTVVALFLGYILAYTMIHVRETHQVVMMTLLVFAMWVSVLIRAFSWVVVLGDQGLLNTWLMSAGLIDRPLSILFTPTAVVIGMVHYMIPIATLPLFTVMRDIDPRLSQAARSLGANSFVTFGRVFFPLSMPGLISSGILVFIFSFGFYITPTILGGGRRTMIAEYISRNVLELPRWGVASMCAVVLLVVTFALLALLGRVANVRQMFGGRL